MAVLEATPSKLLVELSAARAESDRFFGMLKPDAIYDRPIAQRHRVLFYMGHLDGFDSIQICREGLGLRSPDSALDGLFQAGIDPDSNHAPQDTPADWPSLKEVRAYMIRCRNRVDAHLDRASEDVISMALEHRLMHLETLAYMFHNFAHDKKIAPAESQLQLLPSQRATDDLCEISAGDTVLGKPLDGSFGWDNEYQETRSFVPAFHIQRYPVTNREYLRFVEQGAAMPHFWIRRNDSILYRGMFEDVPLPLDCPVYVTQSQAEAYAIWLGKKVASEEQFHRAAYGTPNGEERAFPWGSDAPSHIHGNLDFKRWGPESIYAAPAGNSAFGVSQLVGNGWEWTSTPFGPLPGFAPRPTYPGYSANFFDGDHYVMKGGSQRTAARLLRRSFRNWFRRDYPYTYAKFRCVES